MVVEAGQGPMEDRILLEARVPVEAATPVGMVPLEYVPIVLWMWYQRDRGCSTSSGQGCGRSRGLPAVAGDMVQVEAMDEVPVEVVVVVGLIEDSLQAQFLGRKMTFPWINPQHHSHFHWPYCPSGRKFQHGRLLLL